MFKSYIVDPPSRKNAQFLYRTSNGDYQGPEEPPLHDYLKKTGIPIWAYRIGEENPFHITVLFSHGNSKDVPSLHVFISALFDQIVTKCKICITLFLWDYPGFSFSPYTTSDFALMEDHMKLLGNDIVNGELAIEFGITDVPFFIMGHSIGASLQTVLLKQESLVGKIKGCFCMAPFYSLEEMSKNYFLGQMYFQTFLKKYKDFCNVGENVRKRLDPDIVITVVLCSRDDVTTTGHWAMSNFSELVKNGPDNVFMIDALHNSPLLNKSCHNIIASLFNDFLLRTTVIPPEVSEGYALDS